MTPRVKICGVTRLDDALAAAALGADALGFVLWPGSKRAATPDQAAAIIQALPPYLQTFGVFVNAAADDILALQRRIGFHGVQLSGDEPAAILAGLRAPVVRAFRRAPRPAELADWPVAGFLADGAAAGAFGGAGIAAEPALIAALQPTGRLIVAGGLTPANVGAACRRWRPYAVDVASGVEASPGVKDHQKLAAFIAAAKQDV